MAISTRLSVLAALAIIMVACACEPVSTVGVTSLYVAPGGDDTADGSSPGRALASLTGARKAIRRLKKSGGMTQPVTVIFKGGLYEMDDPVVFFHGDSGTSEVPVTYQAAPGETPVLSGGKVITGWREENGRWITDIPDVKNGGWDFIQLFVNGQLRHRARIPNEGFNIVAGFPEGTPKTVGYHTDCKRFQYAPGDIDPNWKNIGDVEVIVYHFWTDSHLPIESIDAETRTVTFKHRAGKVFTDDFTEDGARYIVENVYEGLDAPGEWYLDRKTGVLEYIPMPGETLADAEIIAPVIRKFLSIEGDPMNREFVEHITFRGLSFQYTNWRLPVGNSNDRQGSASVPAAITSVGARHIAFENCIVKNIGTWAFELRDGCSHNRIARNEISYIAAGGFRVTGGDDGAHPLLHTSHNEITDNHLHHYGELYPSAVGVLLQHTFSNTVAHNEIDHGWYTGVSVGWEWGYQRSISRDNVIEYNHIHDIGQTGLLSDMGGIYTLGVSPGTVLRNNLIHDVNANHYGGWGIYNDEGSTHILVENNIVYNTKFAGYNIHYAKEITVRNNIFALSLIDELSLGRVEPHVSCYFEQNIIYWKDGVLMRGFKEDQEYEFHFSPRGERGTRKMSSTIEADWNIYYRPGAPADSVKIGDRGFADWQDAGRDTHSRYTDPMFVDVDTYDFRLKPQSPAFDMGFTQIDMSTVGPR